MKTLDDTTVTVIGSGYVGTTTAALLANVSVKTFAVDIDKSKIAKLKDGKAPFYEAGLDALVADGVHSSTLLPTLSYEESVASSDIVFSSVGTPDKPDGSPNLEYVFKALESIAAAAKNDIIYVQKSTVPVGTGRKLIDHWKLHSDKELTYVSAPEFLREGTAVIDSIEPDRIVVGGENKEANQRIAALFLRVFENRSELSEISGQDLSEAAEPEVHDMGLESAELTKVTANAFLALKISFANAVAKLADSSNADIKEVMDAVGADNRIGRAFLNAGRGYGGGCFPKDVSGLISASAEFGVDMNIMSAASTLNRSMPSYILNKLEAEIGSLAGKTIAVLGLAFKAGTSDVRKSPGIQIANLLVEKNATVRGYDPEANEEASHDLHESIEIVELSDVCMQGSDAVIVATNWSEFSNIELSSPVIVDAMNMFDPEIIKSQGKVYIGVGRR